MFDAITGTTNYAYNDHASSAGYLSDSFTSPVTGSISSVSFAATLGNAPANGSFNVDLFANAGNQPDIGKVTTSGTFQSSALSSTLTTYTFTPTVTVNLTQGTTY